MTPQPQKPPALPEPVPPNCPRCEKPLDGVSLFFWIVPPWMTLSASCPECQHLLHMQIVPIAAVPQDPDAPPRPRIVS